MIKEDMGLLYELGQSFRIDYVIKEGTKFYSVDDFGNKRYLDLTRYDAIIIPVMKKGQLTYDFKNNLDVKVVKLK